jgi:hypothetical protein
MDARVVCLQVSSRDGVFIGGEMSADGSESNRWLAAELPFNRSWQLRLAHQAKAVGKSLRFWVDA